MSTSHDDDTLPVVQKHEPNEEEMIRKEMLTLANFIQLIDEKGQFS